MYSLMFNCGTGFEMFLVCRASPKSPLFVFVAYNKTIIRRSLVNCDRYSEGDL